MERLTYEKSRSVWDRGKYPTKYTSRHTFQEVVARLAAYEDTGLEPKEVVQTKLALMGKVLAEIKEFEGVPADRMIELAQAEKDERLVVLPCKVGDTVWTNTAIVGDRYRLSNRPYPVEVVFIGIGGNGGFFHAQYSNGRVFPFDFDKVGKTVFLTREEAEAALKKRGRQTMRLVDADEAKKLERMVTLKPSERALFKLMLDRMPTYEPPNAPLTLEELRDMDGEPVWCINGNGGQWGLVHVFSAEGETYVECVTKTGFTMDKMTYGAMGIYAWLAYRRKPEEGTL